MNTQNSDTNKKATRIFYEGWLDYILSCEQDWGKEYAAELAKAILLSIFGRDYDTSKATIDAYIKGTVLPLSDAAQERYQRSIINGGKGGATLTLSKEDNLLIAQMRQQRKTQKEIAQHFKVSEKTIQRSEGWQNWQLLLADRTGQNWTKPDRTEVDNWTRQDRTGQNLYVYEYEYDNVYNNDNENEYDNNSSVAQHCIPYIIEKNNIVDSRTGEVVAKIEDANYGREDYWDNVENPVLELQEDPSLAAVLSKYPNYLSLPMLGADCSFPDKQGWAFPPFSAPREKQHLDAAALGYRLCKIEKED